jgi:hypothetical protein
MDALFFLTRRDDALGVASSDDLPCEPVADPLRLEDPSPLAGLAEVLGADARIRPLRDATCRSFPVWELGAELTRRIAALGDDGIDDVAERWRKHSGGSLDADLYEVATCLVDLRNAARPAEAGETLFALLEERAW